MDRFDFSFAEYEMLIARCGFSEDEEKIFNMRRKGKSVVEISIALSLSTRTVDRRIRSIKHKIKRELWR